MYQDYLTVLINEDSYRLPYLLINQTAPYPEIAGFELEPAVQDESKYQLRLQVANDSDELIVDIYDPVTFTYLDQLHFQTDIEAGLFETEIDLSDLKLLDHYLINVTIQTGTEPTHFQQILSR